jgi:hypothetical protein
VADAPAPPAEPAGAVAPAHRRRAGAGRADRALEDRRRARAEAEERAREERRRAGEEARVARLEEQAAELTGLAERAEAAALQARADADAALAEARDARRALDER